MRTVLTISALIGCFGLQIAANATGYDHDRARLAFERGEILSLSRILEIVRADVPGRIIEVELETEEDRHIYEVEVLGPDGRVTEVEIDAASGEILEREIEDR